MAKKAHYIDNKQFYAEMVKYYDSVWVAREQGLLNPPATEFMGKLFILNENNIKINAKNEVLALIIYPLLISWLLSLDQQQFFHNVHK